MKSSDLAELHVGSSLVSDVLGMMVFALVLVATEVVGGILNIELPKVPSLCSRVAWSSVRSVDGAALNSWTPSLSYVGASFSRSRRAVVAPSGVEIVRGRTWSLSNGLSPLPGIMTSVALLDPGAEPTAMPNSLIVS